jgi:phospholipid-binding lipoprotein MlaA
MSIFARLFNAILKETPREAEMIGIRLLKLLKLLVFIGILSVVAGCATTSNGEVNDDPIEPANRVFFDVSETLDKHLMKPIAEAYVEVTPTAVRTSVTNFFDNLTYLNVILNDFLQGKFNQGLTDILRFTYNSIFGIGGLFDVSTDIGMPKNDEDFGQTLAHWGFDKGAYLYIPLMGPNTVRDSTDYVPSTLLNPFYYISSAVLWPVSAINIVNTRANLLEASDLRDEAAVDPYAFTREAYLQQREYKIYDGNPPITGYDDIFGEAGDDDEAGVLVIE